MTTRLLFAALTVIATPIAMAQDAAALLRKHHCHMCHSPNGDGETFEAMAAKYSGKADATATLVAVIKKGTGEMPPTAVSDAEASALASYILAAKK